MRMRVRLERLKLLPLRGLSTLLKLKPLQFQLLLLLLLLLVLHLV